MRTINEAPALIKKQDPDTAVTYNFIRKLLDGDMLRRTMFLMEKSRNGISNIPMTNRRRNFSESLWNIMRRQFSLR